jgi:hypothetical protein
MQTHCQFPKESNAAIRPLDGGPEHHQEDEAMYILKGEYEIQCGDQVIRATPGVFVFLPRDSQEAAAVATCRAATVYGGEVLAEAKIESRPLRGSPFEYLFYLDFIGRADSTPISEALAGLRALAKSVRVLETYPRYKQ